MKRIFFVIVLFSVCVTTTTCKKISKYPFNMAGRWVGNDFCPVYLEINKDSYGHYGSFSLDKGCNGKQWKGKVTCTKAHLYVGSTSFKFINKPCISIGNDSISDSWENVSHGKVRIIATMTLKSGFLHHNNEVTFYKILDY